MLRLDTNTRIHGPAVVLTVTGEVDLATASILAKDLDTAMRSSPAAVVVDLSGVDFLASVGMSVLIATRDKAQGATTLAVVAVGPFTRRPMELVGLDAVIPIYSDLEAALASIDTAREDVTHLTDLIRPGIDEPDRQEGIA
ncbi:STAS domain-containing protein [Rhodococcus sovatensis]|uniref:Anti-sigma factor antagonist n=1 Tax=Rhodococcus sovatensis TaxID=1805840 RepID=A0ABZ2PNR9_9NOCA